MIRFEKSHFVTSAAGPEGFPPERLPEVALIGRSNVGKSSLINHLCRNKNLAKVSSTPGKTQLINFFTVDEACTLVDLPGYGFAKAPPHAQKAWAAAIEAYLSARPALLALLIDLRRSPSKEDTTFIEWARYYRRDLLLIGTKGDKLSKRDRDKALKTLQEEIAIETAISYSVKEGAGRNALIAYIERWSHATPA